MSAIPTEAQAGDRHDPSSAAGNDPSSIAANGAAIKQNDARIQAERSSQHLVTAFVLSGLFFMLLPGTFLGVWSLIDISRAHLPSALPQAWLQAHGQAQIFGWIGSFIIGIGFYSLTKMQSSKRFPSRAGWIAWVLWTAGVSLRWIGGVMDWQWRILLPLSALLELAGFLLFFRSVRARSARSGSPPLWIRMVGIATGGFLITLLVNFGILLHQAIVAGSPALPHVLDQQFVDLSVWGVLVPTIWGFNSRWLPIFAGLQEPHGKRLFAAYLLLILGIATTFAGFWPIAAVAFFLASLTAIDALRIWEPAIRPAKLINVHPSFPIFLRITYGWLLVSAILALVAVPFDHSGGIFGASRHALTVGFVASMVFAIGQRVLPAFCGMRVLFSTQVMFWSLCLLSIGCFLRVVSEALAYQEIWAPAWKILPVSAIIEITAVCLFAFNLVATLLRPPAHLRASH